MAESETDLYGNHLRPTPVPSPSICSTRSSIHAASTSRFNPLMTSTPLNLDFGDSFSSSDHDSTWAYCGFQLPVVTDEMLASLPDQSTNAYCTGWLADLPAAAAAAQTIDEGSSTISDSRRSLAEVLIANHSAEGRRSTTVSISSSSSSSEGINVAGDSYTRPKEYKQSDEYKCGQCNQVFHVINDLMSHREGCFPDTIPEIEEFENEIVHRYQASQALNGTTRYIRFTPINPPVQPLDFLTSIREQIENAVDSLLNGCVECKVQPVLALRIIQIDPIESDILRSERQLFSLPAEVINNDTFFDYILNGLMLLIDEFVQNGSNWLIESVEWFDLRITRYHSVPYKRGHRFINLPPTLKAKKACVNVDNGGASDCFKYAVLSVLHYNDVRADYRHRTWAYKEWIDELNFTGLSFPITASDIPRFEKLNPGIFINLVEWDESNKVQPLRMLRACGYPKQETDKEARLVTVLTFERGDIMHYVGVTNINRLLNCRESSLQTHHAYKHCERCFQPFKTAEWLQRHRQYCYTGQPETLVPSADKTFHIFEKWQAVQQLPYVVYMDIECFLEKSDKEEFGNSVTHKAAAISYLLVPHQGLLAAPVDCGYRQFVGPDCVLNCMHSLTDLAKEIYEWNQDNAKQPVSLSMQERHRHERTTHCYLCGIRFNKRDSTKKTIKVVEHDHLTGK